MTVSTDRYIVQRGRQTAQYITVDSGQLTEFLNNILKPDLTFKFSTVSYLNICALHITGKTLL